VGLLRPFTFATTGAGTFGSAVREIADVAPVKTFPIRLREGMKLQFRSEFFNVPNRSSLGKPNVSAGSARALQFALKAPS